MRMCGGIVSPRQSFADVNAILLREIGCPLTTNLSRSGAAAGMSAKAGTGLSQDGQLPAGQAPERAGVGISDPAAKALWP